MDYVCGAYAPRLEKGITEQRYNQVREEIWFQLLKSRSGSADPTGKKYRLDPSTMRISRWEAQVQIPNMYRAEQASVWSTPSSYDDEEQF